jgi:hypothetical protein
MVLHPAPVLPSPSAARVARRSSANRITSRNCDLPAAIFGDQFQAGMRALMGRKDVSWRAGPAQHFHSHHRNSVSGILHGPYSRIREAGEIHPTPPAPVAKRCCVPGSVSHPQLTVTLGPDARRANRLHHRRGRTQMPRKPPIISVTKAWSSAWGRPDTVTVPTTPTPLTRIGKAPPSAANSLGSNPSASSSAMRIRLR